MFPALNTSRTVSAPTGRQRSEWLPPSNRYLIPIGARLWIQSRPRPSRVNDPSIPKVGSKKNGKFFLRQSLLSLQDKLWAWEFPCRPNSKRIKHIINMFPKINWKSAKLLTPRINSMTKSSFEAFCFDLKSQIGPLHSRPGKRRRRSKFFKKKNRKGKKKAIPSYVWSFLDNPKLRDKYIDEYEDYSYIRKNYGKRRAESQPVTPLESPSTSSGLAQKYIDHPRYKRPGESKSAHKERIKHMPMAYEQPKKSVAPPKAEIPLIMVHPKRKCGCCRGPLTKYTRSSYDWNDTFLANPRCIGCYQKYGSSIRNDKYYPRG